MELNKSQYHALVVKSIMLIPVSPCLPVGKVTSHHDAIFCDRALCVRSHTIPLLANPLRKAHVVRQLLATACQIVWSAISSTKKVLRRSSNHDFEIYTWHSLFLGATVRHVDIGGDILLRQIIEPLPSRSPCLKTQPRV